MDDINSPIKIFISYSHKDEDLRQELDNHLKILQHSGYITTWQDRKIAAGNEWENEINENLLNSEIILFLVSSNFLASDYCYDVEMKTALKLHENGTSVVIPIILRDCIWQTSLFGKLQALPTDGKPIISREWYNQHEALTDISQKLLTKIKDIQNSKLITKKEPADIISNNNQEFKILLNQIPIKKKYFSGREDKLYDLEEAYKLYPFILIEGPGGIGKTQLAAKFIEKNELKNTTVWYECHPTSQPDDIIRGAGFGQLLIGENKTEREKLSAFKDKIEEFNLNIFLDNFQETRDNKNFVQFLDFIDEYLSKGHVIVIGRDNINSPTLRPKGIHLGSMGQDSFTHAKELIKYAYGESISITDESLKQICSTLQGYPLAIDLAIYLLSLNVPIDDIINEAIIQAETSLGSKETISQRLLNKIFTRTDAKKEEREFLKLFSVYRGKIHENAVRAIMPDNIFKAGRRMLVMRNLLTIENNHYELHPLIREFSYKLLDERSLVHLKAAKYYEQQRTRDLNPELEEKIFYHLSYANEGNEILQIIIDRGRDFILLGHLDRLEQMITFVKENGITNVLLEIFEADIAEERGNWHIALNTFKKISTDDSVQKEINIEATIKYGEMLSRFGKMKDAKIVFEELMRTGILFEFKKWHARVLNNLGTSYDFFGDKAIALKFFDEALEIRNNLVDREDIAATLYSMATLKQSLGEMDMAIDICRSVISITKEIGNRTNEAEGISLLGIIKAELCEFDEALKLHEESLKIKTSIGTKSGQADCLGNIAYVKANTGKYNEALELYKRSLAIKKEIGSDGGIATHTGNIGFIKKILGQTKEALECYNESLSIREKMEDKLGIATSYSNIGTIEKILGNIQTAITLEEKSLVIFKEIDYKHGIANSLAHLGSYQMELGNFKEANNLLENSLQIQKYIGNKNLIAAIIGTLGSIKLDQGEIKPALKFYEKALDIAREVGNKAALATCFNNIGYTKRVLGQYNEALDLFEKSLEIKKEMGDKSAIAVSLNNIASIQRILGSPIKALNTLLESLEISREIGDKSIAAANLSNIALVKKAIGDIDEAAKYFEDSLKIYAEIDDKSALANTLALYGDFLIVTCNKYHEGVLHLLKSISLYNEMGISNTPLLEVIMTFKNKIGISNFKEIINVAYTDLEETLKKHIDLALLLGEPRKVEDKLGRNDLCFCGSRKKYKHCHGKNS